MLKMAELKLIFEKMGLARVQTYINSGNILFESREEAGWLRQRMEEQIETSFGFSVSVILRSAEEWEMIVKHCPFAAASLSEKESIHVTFLVELPALQGIESQTLYKSEDDELYIHGKEIYQLYRQSMLDSKLLRLLPKLDGPVTARNWKTVIKLSEMVNTMGKTSG